MAAETETRPVRLQTPCEPCQGNGEIVIDWSRYLHSHEGDQGDEAVADCPDCNGTGYVDSPSDDPVCEALPPSTAQAGGGR